MTSNTPLLLPQHQALIDGSGIATEVAAAGGYRTVTTKAEMQRLGFSASQVRVPALLDQVDDGEAVGHEKLTLAEFAAQWLEAVEPSLRPSTFRRYADMLRVHILPQLGTRQLAKLTPSDL